MAQLFLDNFTAADQPLTTYNSNYVSVGANNTGRIVSNAVRFDSGGFTADAVYYRSDISVPNNGGYIEGTFTATGTTGNIALVYRVDTDNEYIFQYGSGTIWIRRRIGGSLVDASTRINAPTSLTSEPITMRLEVNGQELRAYWDDLTTPALTSNNAANSLTSAGNPGISVQHGNASLDDFLADDGQAPGQIPQETPAITTPITVSHTTATINFTYPGSDATGFEYRIDGGSAVTLAASPVMLTGLTPETSYTVEVRATNATGEGSWSSVESFTTTAAPTTPPTGTPSSVNVTPSDTSASVTFSYTAGDATGYEYRLDSGTPVAITGTSFSIPSLTQQTSYSLEVRAVNADGNGAWSTAVNFTTTATPTAPQGTPTGITVTPDTTSAAVTFTYSGTDADSYEYRVDGGSPVAISGTSFTISSLTEDTQYSLEIRAVNAVGNGAWSAATTFNTNPAATTRGVRGDEVPSTGTHGPSAIFSSLNLPAENADIFYAEVTTTPTPAGLTFNDNGSFTWENLAVGTHEFDIEIFKNDVSHVTGFIRVNVT